MEEKHRLDNASLPGLFSSRPALLAVLFRHLLLVLSVLLAFVLFENDFGSLEFRLDSFASLRIDLNLSHLLLEPLVDPELAPVQLLLAEHVAFLRLVLVILRRFDVVLLFPLFVEILLVRRRHQSPTFGADHLLLWVVSVVLSNETFLLAIPLHSVLVLSDVVRILTKQVKNFTLNLAREVLLEAETFFKVVVSRHVRNVKLVVFEVLDVFHPLFLPRGPVGRRENLRDLVLVSGIQRGFSSGGAFFREDGLFFLTG